MQRGDRGPVASHRIRPRACKRLAAKVVNGGDRAAWIDSDDEPISVGASFIAQRSQGNKSRVLDQIRHVGGVQSHDMYLPRSNRGNALRGWQILLQSYTLAGGLFKSRFKFSPVKLGLAVIIALV